MAGAAGAVLVAAGLAWWPLPAPGGPADVTNAPFAGSVHQARQPADGRSVGIRMARAVDDVPIASSEVVPRLVGITGSGAQARAWLRSSDGETIAVSVGEELDGWQIRFIRAREVHVAMGGDERQLQVFASTSPVVGSSQ